jgi:hypothetical protein
MSGKILKIPPPPLLINIIEVLGYIIPQGIAVIKKTNISSNKDCLFLLATAAPIVEVLRSYTKNAQSIHNTDNFLLPWVGA